MLVLVEDSAEALVSSYAQAGGARLLGYVPDLRLCDVVVLADQARDDGFSPDAA